jgi:translation initiation factor IF-3
VVSLLAADRRQLGVFPTAEARRMAEEHGLELIMVDDRADPPVARMVDFPRFKYEQAQKERGLRRERVLPTKQMHIDARIDPHDLSIKAQQVGQWLTEGSPCRVIVAYQSPAPVHRQAGRAVLDELVEAVLDRGQGEIWDDPEQAIAFLWPR